MYYDMKSIGRKKSNKQMNCPISKLLCVKFILGALCVCVCVCRGEGGGWYTSVSGIVSKQMYERICL